MSALARWRHRHGHGVHSPFAYQLIREVITPGRKYRYYAEEETEDPHLRRVIRLTAFIHRVKAAPDGAASDIGGCEYIPCPVTQEVERLEKALRKRGGLLLTARDYLIAVERPSMAFQCYLI